jgi:UDP-N-acetylmuramyl pentapeptide phosphotransferase/UDP-N-acetylglucosamine-1-phosphate transferase
MNSPDALTAACLFVLSALLSWAGVELFRRWSVQRNLLDVPNERSSHSVPTPRGGGIVIAIVSLVGYAAITLLFDLQFSWGYFIGAVLVTTVSWLDDLYSLGFWSRLLVHIAAAVILISNLGPWNGIFIPLVSSEIGLGTVLGWVITVSWVVWAINAYNFMDGIDGIAGTQSLVAGIAWSLFALVFQIKSGFLFGGIVGGVSAGFLIHNWQPARIFMGDVVSAFLGFTLAAMPLLALSEKPEITIIPVVGLLFLWFFAFDSVTSRIRRALKHPKFWEPRREHIYQLMVIGGMKHSRVAMLYGLSAALLSTSLILAIGFSGIFIPLTIFLFLSLTASITFIGVRKTR